MIGCEAKEGKEICVREKGKPFECVAVVGVCDPSFSVVSSYFWLCSFTSAMYSFLSDIFLIRYD